jgi:hypothetical protein
MATAFIKSNSQNFGTTNNTREEFAFLKATTKERFILQKNFIFLSNNLVIRILLFKVNKSKHMIRISITAYYLYNVHIN